MHVTKILFQLEERHQMTKLQSPFDLTQQLHKSNSSAITSTISNNSNCSILLRWFIKIQSLFWVFLWNFSYLCSLHSNVSYTCQDGRWWRCFSFVLIIICDNMVGGALGRLCHLVITSLLWASSSDWSQVAHVIQQTGSGSHQNELNRKQIFRSV